MVRCAGCERWNETWWPRWTRSWRLQSLGNAILAQAAVESWPRSTEPWLLSRRSALLTVWLRGVPTCTGLPRSICYMCGSWVSFGCWRSVYLQRFDPGVKIPAARASARWRPFLTGSTCGASLFVETAWQRRRPQGTLGASSHAYLTNVRCACVGCEHVVCARGALLGAPYVSRV